ncbi:hypothetical protein [Paenibacillus humicus]|uniref:hypothetical protein n=1 Tax=Paenibacillus humicus TaxID=412861 RepID=UPI003D28A7F9
MMGSHNNLVAAAQALVDVTQEYLMEIQSNEEWFLITDGYVAKQSELVKDIQSTGISSLSLPEQEKVQELLRVCYQLELQINNEIARQHSIVGNQINQLRKGNNFRNKYESASLGSGIMLDTYK